MTSKPTITIDRPKPGRFVFLTERQALLIDKALHEVGDFGEVRLIVEKRRLRFLETVHSRDILKLQIEESP